MTLTPPRARRAYDPPPLTHDPDAPAVTPYPARPAGWIADLGPANKWERERLQVVVNLGAPRTPAQARELQATRGANAYAARDVLGYTAPARLRQVLVDRLDGTRYFTWEIRLEDDRWYEVPAYGKNLHDALKLADALTNPETGATFSLMQPPDGTVFACFTHLESGVTTGLVAATSRPLAVLRAAYVFCLLAGQQKEVREG